MNRALVCYVTEYTPFPLLNSVYTWGCHGNQFRIDLAGFLFFSQSSMTLSTRFIYSIFYSKTKDLTPYWFLNVFVRQCKGFQWFPRWPNGMWWCVYGSCGFLIIHALILSLKRRLWEVLVQVVNVTRQCVCVCVRPVRHVEQAQPDLSSVHWRHNHYRKRVGVHTVLITQ